MEETQNNNQELNTWSLCLYAMKSPVTGKKYQKRLEKFFDSIGLEGKTVEEKSRVFVNTAKKEGNEWIFNQVLKFMQFQIDRANRKEITGSTIRKNKTNGLFLTLLVIIGIFYVCSTGDVFSIAKATTNNDNQGDVFVMYAGSLVKIFEDAIGPAFQNKTGYAYVGEGKGSVQVANLIRDGFRTPDVFVSAGPIPIMRLMNNTPPLAEWLLEFGSAEMVIAYSTNSPYYSDLEKARKGEIPWYDVISKEGFKFGRTDPELDPKGYYAIMTANLANIYYNDSSIKERILGKDRDPKQIFPEEILKTILESGQLDAVVAYKHEAVSRGLSYITLPEEINLGNPVFSWFYKKANYTSESDQKTIYGEPVFFSITIPQTVKNLEGALSFVNFITSKNGSQILENQGLNSIDTISPKGDTNKIPLSIKDEIHSNMV